MTARTDQVQTIARGARRARSSRSIDDGGERVAGRDRAARRLPLRLRQAARGGGGVVIDRDVRGGAGRRRGRRGHACRPRLMTLVEINFDGIVGPSHNYAGLSPGNLAATRNAGATSHPRAAALQGIAKMRANLALGLTQGILLPHAAPRPSLAGEPGDRLCRRAAAPAGAGAVGLGDVGGERRDRLARPRHRRRPLPPDRRQPGDDAASQPRMARDAGAAAARLRRPGVRGPRPRPRPVRRRGRGQPHAAVRARTTRRASRCSSTARAAAPSPRASTARRREAVARAHRLDPARTLFVAAIRRGDRRGRVPQRCRRGRQRARAVRARTGVRGPAPRFYADLARARCPRSRSSRCPPPRSAWPTRSRPICSTRSW